MVWSGDLDQTTDSLVIRSTRDIRIKAMFALATSSGDPSVELPLKTTLLPNYPNPFNPTTTIRWEQDKSNKVRIDIYDLNGRHVKNLISAFYSSGVNDIVFDANGLASGVLIVVLRTGDVISHQKIVLLK